MSSREKVAVQRACLLMATMIFSSTRGAGGVVIHADVDLGEHSEFLQLIFKQIDQLVNKEQKNSKTLSQMDSEVASTLLQVVPSVTIKGNITDPERRLALTFTVHASRSHPSSTPMVYNDDDEDDEEDDEWRSSSGVLNPIVGVVEPYFLGFVELVFNSILSTVISNFLEGSNLLGDVRLV